MRRFASVALLAALVCPTLAGQSPEFEVASIKRNTINQFATGPPPNPSSGLFSMINVPARTIVFRAYPLQTNAPAAMQILGLPSWAESERYDVVAKGKAGATPEEQQQMWRALLADRMKLAAHYETRELPSWDLVFARSDHRLGPQIKPSTLDCSQPAGPTPRPAPGADMKQMAMNRCSSFYIDRDETMYSGGVTMASLIRMMAPAADRAIVDRTGLEGFFSVALRFQRIPRQSTTPSPDDPPVVFTAVQEQLGLKLESSKTQAQVLVIDHIERFTED
jgi:uncharacterized protein (TIGR03435 family)